MSLTWSPTNTTVYTEQTATFVFKDDDVRAMYIDWDDGPLINLKKLTSSGYNLLNLLRQELLNILILHQVHLILL